MKQRNKILPILRYASYLLAVLPMFLFRDFTAGNELRYLSIADEALRNGNFFTFTNHGVVYADKPPLYLWIVMLGRWLFGSHNMLFLALFSFVPALVIMAVMDNWVKKLMPEDARLATQLMLLTSGFFIGSAVVLRMDMLMSMFIVLALYVFFRKYEGEERKYDWLLFPLFVFMALFSKGPLGILIPLISTAVFLLLKKQIKTFVRYWNWKTWLVLLVFSGLWFLGVYMEGGSRYLDNLLFNQTVNRAVNSFSHKEPFYYYMISVLYSLAPWSLLIAGIFIAWFRSKQHSSDLELFFISVAASTFVALSFFSSKLAVYLLPTFPFFVYTAMLWLSRMKMRRWVQFLVLIPAALMSLALPAIAIASRFPFMKGISLSPLVFVAALCLSGAAIAAIALLMRNQFYRAVTYFASGILLTVFVISWAIPNYNKYLGMREISEMAKKEATVSGIENYYFVGMFRMEDLDVYLNAVPKKIRTTELYRADSPIKKPAIVLTREKGLLTNDTLRAIANEHHAVRCGDHYYFRIE
jgi:4-amino-4-deoxy-L-arabinose transferase-like glycosyltransferase